MENVHPITVHFTIALFSLAILFEILGWVFTKESLKAASWWNLLFAVPAAITSVLSGRNAALSAPHDNQIHRVIEIHETLGYIVLAVIVVLFLWRTLKSGMFYRRFGVPFVVFGILGFGAMSAGAYFGGELVFTHGMGVKPMMEIMSAESHDHSDHAANSEEKGHTSENNDEKTSHDDRQSQVSDEKKESEPDDHDAQGSHQH